MERSVEANLVRCTAWSAALLAAVATAVTLAGISAPLRFDTWAAVHCLWGFVAIVWLVAIVWRWEMGRDPSERGRWSFRRSSAWFAVPVLCLGTVILECAGVPLHVRFRLSRSALESYVAELTQPGAIDAQAHSAPGTVGLFEIKDVMRTQGVIRLVTGRDGAGYGHGFAYCVEEPSGLPLDSFSKLAPRWYIWYSYK